MHIVSSLAVGLLVGLSAALPSGSRLSQDAPTSENPHHLFSRAINFGDRTSCADDAAKYLWDATDSFHSTSLTKPTTSSTRFAGFSIGARIFVKEYNLGVKPGDIAHCRLVLGSIAASGGTTTPPSGSASSHQQVSSAGSGQVAPPSLASSQHPAPLEKRTSDKWTWTDTELYEVHFQRDDKTKTYMHTDLWHVMGANPSYSTKLGAIIDAGWTHARVYNEARKLELAHPEYFKMRVVPLLPGIGPIISYVSGKKASINCEDFYTKMKTILKSPPAANYQIQYTKPVSASDAGSSLNRTPEESESGEPVSTG